MGKLILDYSKWVCGAGGEHKLGVGGESLLNPHGYMCCLGQWCSQLGATEEMLAGEGDPTDIDFEKFKEEGVEGIERIEKNICTSPIYKKKFYEKAIDINDGLRTTPGEKAEALKKLCESHGIELETINFPS